MQKNDFTKGKVSSQIIQLAIPMTIAQLISILYNVVDRIYIGNISGSGSLALSGIGLTFPIITIILAFANLVGMGGAPLSSIERGKEDNEKASRIMGVSFLLLCAFGILVPSIIYIIKEPLLYAFGASNDTYVYANDYLSIYLLGSIFVMITIGLNSFINAQGFGKQGMITTLIGAILNIILDPIFIFIFHLGVKGAAMATVISQFISMLWTLYFLKSDIAILRLSKKYMVFDFSLIREIITLGFSGFIMAITNSIVQIVCNSTLSFYGGDLYIGIMTIITSVREMTFMPVTGITHASQPVMGYNYGAKQYNRVKKGIHFISIIATVYLLLIWGILFLFPEFFISIFNTDVEVLRLGVPAFHTYYFGFCFMAFQVCGQSVFIALNKPKHAIFFSIFRKVIIVAPLTLYLPTIPSIGIMGVFLAEPISNVIGGLASYIAMYFSIYRKLN